MKINKFFVKALLIIMIYSCGDSPPPIDYSPQDQDDYRGVWKGFYDEYKNSDTEAKRSHWNVNSDKHLNQNLMITNWYGKVTDVGIDYITVKYDGIKYYLYPKGKADYLQFDKGMELLFTGRLNGKYWLDGISSPGVYVDCMKIMGVNNKSYFSITEQELKKYKSGLKMKEDFNNLLNESWNEFEKALEEMEE